MAQYYGNPQMAALAQQHNAAAMAATASMANARHAASANRYGSAVDAPAPFAQAYGQIGSAFAAPFGTVAPSLASAYGGLAGGLGQTAAAMGNERAGLFNSYAGMAGQFPAALANAYGSYASGTAGLAPSMANMYGQYTSGLGGLANAQANERVGMTNAYQTGLSNMGAANSNAYGNYAQGVASLGASAGQERTGLFNTYGSALGSLATADANERSNMAGAAAQAEAARQLAMGNIGTASLGAYGSAANSALAAWAAQQQAYNKAMSDTAVANQAALGSSSGGRNAALANLGASYANLAGQGAAASVQPNVQFNMGGLGGTGGGSFTASGPSGLVSSGGYSDSGISGGGLSGSRTTDTSQIGSLSAPGFAGLEATRGDVASGDRTMVGTYMDAADRLDRSNAAAFGMPQATLAQVLGGLATLGDQSISGSSRGMDQFYASQLAAPRGNQRSLDMLDNAYAGAARRASNARELGMLGAGFQDTRADNRALADQFANIFNSPSTPYADYAAAMGAGFGGAMGGIDSLRGDLGAGFGQTSRSMRSMGRDFANQYNNAAGRVDYSSVLNPLISGFGQTAGAINSLPGAFERGMAAARGPLGGLWNDTRDIVWNSPAVKERLRREGLQERQRTDAWQKSQRATRNPPKKYDRSKVIPVGGWKPVGR